MTLSQWETSDRALVLHELLDLGLRCRENPGDSALAAKFARLAASVTPVLVQRLRSLEIENEELRRSAVVTCTLADAR